MPRVLLLLFFFALACRAEARLGLKAGLTWATLEGDSIDEPFEEVGFTRSAPRERLGFVFGVAVAKPVSRFVEGHAEVIYVQKGAEYTGTVGAWMGTFRWSGTMKLDYLEAPVFVRLHQPTPAGVRPYLDLGFYAAMLLDARFERELEGDATISGLWTQTDDGDFGAVLGVGLDITVNGGHVYLEARYTPGLIGVQEHGDEIRNTNLALAAAVAF